jgi:hypothetical protein
MKKKITIWAVCFISLIVLAVSQINGFSSFAFNPPVAEPDIDRDGGVDGSDLALLIKAYGSDKDDLNFDPLCDFVIDLKVDELDLEAWAPYFGNTGAWAAPYPIDVAGGVVFVTDDTASAPMSEARYYACAPSMDEGGPEIVYTFVAPYDGTLTLSLSYSSGTDVDVHLLSAPSAEHCVARGNLGLSRSVDADAQYWIAVDTYCASGICMSGPFNLSIGFASP